MATEDTDTPDAVALAQAAKIAAGLRDVRYGDGETAAGAEASGAAEPAMLGFEGATISATALDALVEQMNRGEVPELTVTEDDIYAIAASIRQKCAAEGVQPSEVEALIEAVRGNIGAPRAHLAEIRMSAMHDAHRIITDLKFDKTDRAVEQMNKLSEEMQKLRKEITEDMKALDLFKTPEERRKEKEKQEEVERLKAEYDRLMQDPTATEEQKHRAKMALEEAEKKLTETQKETATRISEDPNSTPDAKRRADDVLPKFEELKAKQEELIAKTEAAYKASGRSNQEIADIISRRRKNHEQSLETLEGRSPEEIAAMIQEYTKKIDDVATIEKLEKEKRKAGITADLQQPVVVPLVTKLEVSKVQPDGPVAPSAVPGQSQQGQVEVGSSGF